MVHIKTEDEIKKMRVAGKILAAVSKKIRVAAAKEGTTLKELDDLARTLIREAGAKPAFLGYQPYGAQKPYPCTVCASVNDVVVHGVPGDYALKSGDIVKLDFGVIYDGYHADAAWTIPVGKISAEAKKLMKVTEKALYEGIKQTRNGKTLGDIGFAIQSYVEKHGFKVVKGLTGHGIGKGLHEEPTVYNEGQKGAGMPLEAGMTIAIEPMVSAGSANTKQLDDDSYATEDGSLSAHFEHTVLITKRGPEILTK